MKYNPSVKDFLEEKPKLTVIGLVWAGTWRLQLVVTAIMFGLTIVFAGLGVLI